MANAICVPMPSFLDPIEKLLQTTIDKTQIQPGKFQAPTFSFSIQVPVQVPVSFPIPYPPPSHPFTVLIDHPIFGRIESPVFIPHGFEKKHDRNNRRSKRGKIGQDTKSNEEILAPGAAIVGSTNSQILELQESRYFQEYITQEQMELYLNLSLIYFKCVESRVNSTLAETTSQSPCQTNLENLNSLTNDLRGLIESLEKFYAEEDLVISEIEGKKQFQEILHCTSRLQTVLEQLDSSNICGLLQKNVDKREEHMLCSILGLEEEIAEYLINLDPEIRNHQTDEHWVLCFIDQKEEVLEDNGDIKLSLIKLGFTAAKAQYLANLISQNPCTDHQTLTYFAKKYIEQQFNYHILLSPERNVLCGKDQILNKDYSIDTAPEEGNESVRIPAVDIKMLNQDELTRSEWFTDLLSQEGETLEGSTYWFHGTDHKSARNIMRNGIDLDKGKEGGDFSDGRGFYVTSDYFFAHKWPQEMMKRPNTAVIVFKLKNDIFSSKAGKEFSVDSKEWQNAIGFFRNKKDSNWCGIKKGKELIRCPYIFGPISKDGKDKKNQNWSPRARTPKVFELCLKDDLLADDFYNHGHNIHKTIFFY